MAPFNDCTYPSMHLWSYSRFELPQTACLMNSSGFCNTQMSLTCADNPRRRSPVICLENALKQRLENVRTHWIFCRNNLFILFGFVFFLSSRQNVISCGINLKIVKWLIEEKRSRLKLTGNWLHSRKLWSAIRCWNDLRIRVTVESIRLPFVDQPNCIFLHSPCNKSLQQQNKKKTTR